MSISMLLTWWVEPQSLRHARRYGAGHREPRKNLDNTGWQTEL